MANLISKMQEIVDYNKEAGILTKADQESERLHFFSKNGPQINRISELGEAANQFIYNANRNYVKGILMPPSTQQNIQQIYQLFENLNLDLTGSLEGTDEQKNRHHEWQAFWEKQLLNYPELQAKLHTVQHDILAAYRSKTLDYCVFKPHDRSTQKDEKVIQDFLLEVNEKMRSGLTAGQAYDNLSSHFADEINIIPQKPAVLHNHQPQQDK